MTSPPPQKPAPGPRRHTKVAAVLRAGNSLRVVVARAGKAGESPVIVESFRTVDLPPKGAPIKNGKAGAEHVVGVLSAAACTWRRLHQPLPEGSAEQVAGALDLLAEAHAVSVPAHRRCVSALRTIAGGPEVVGLTTWVQDFPVQVASLDALEEVKAYVPAHAALAWLLRMTERGEGLGALAETGDAGAGTIVLAGTGGGDSPACVVRVLREESADAGTWRAAVLEAGEETAGALSLEAPALPDHLPERLVVLPPGLERALYSGAPTTAAWVGEYGLALGAAAAALLAEADEQPLLNMTFDPPGAKGNLLERSALWFGRPARAAALIGVCVLILLLAPLASAWARLSVVASKAAADASRPDRAIYEAARESDLYEFQSQRRWPISKVLAELIGSAPKGVNIESVTVEVGKPATLAGTADAVDTVSNWRTKLNSSGVFDDAKADQNSMQQGGVRFSLTLKVAQPTLAMNADAARFTKDIQDARDSAGTAPAGEKKDSSRTNGRASTPASTTNRTRTDRGTDRTGDRTTTPGPAAKAPKILPPLSDEQIAGLSKTAAMTEFVSRKAASQQAGIDEPTRERLKSEAAKAQARMQSAPAEKAP
ncbi:hypothetical protein BH11PLA1_BH11PLA1_16980 [soil metagenome]